MRFAIIVLLFSTTARRSISTSSEIENPQEPIVKRNLRRLSPFCVSSTCLAGGESEGVTCFPECCCSKKCRTTYDPYLFLSTGVCEYGPAPTTNVAPVTPPPTTLAPVTPSSITLAPAATPVSQTDVTNPESVISTATTPASTTQDIVVLDKGSKKGAKKQQRQESQKGQKKQPKARQMV